MKLTLARITVGVLLANLAASLYLLTTREDLAVGLYVLLSCVTILLVSLPNFDRYIEQQRPYSRINALRLNGGTHTSAQWEQLKRRMNYKCVKCQGLERDVGTLTKDHIIPVSSGGTDNITNIQPLCRKCNSTKGAKIADYR